MQRLLIIALICVPVMLYAKPIYEHLEHKKHMKSEDHSPIKAGAEEGLLSKHHSEGNDTEGSLFRR